MILNILLIIVLFLIIFWQGSLLWASIFGSPIVYSNPEAIIDAIKLTKPQEGELFIDLGCGNGRTLLIASKQFGLKCIGVDRSFFCYIMANIRILLAGERKNIRVVLGNFNKIAKELNRANIVYLYLLNSALFQIEDWFFQNIGNDTRVVSLAFEFPHRKPLSEQTTRNLGRETKVRCYKK